MKKNIFFLALILSLMLIPSVAQASLLGSTIFLAHRSPDAVTSLESYPVTVEAGVGDRNIFGFVYQSNPEDKSILIDFFRPFTFSNEPFNGHIGTFIAPSLTGVNVNTNLSGWDFSRLTYTKDSFAFNWSGLSVTNQSYFYASLDFDRQQTLPSAPEPATFLLLGSGLTSLFFQKRRKRFQK